MSDEEKPAEKPKIDAAWLRERSERLRREADEALVRRDREETAAIVADIAAQAERQIAAFRVLPCRGEIARIGECSSDFAASCERRNTPSCPRRIAEVDEQQAANELRDRLVRLGVPERVRIAILENFYSTPETMAVDQWLESGKNLLLLAGAPGTGKSVAAGYALKRRVGRWCHVSEIADVYGLDRAAVVAKLKKARFLVLDDVGSEQASDGAKAALTSVILVRFEEQLPTILTSNLDPNAWKVYVDDRVRDRLAGDGHVHGSSGPSRRRA